MKLSLNWANHLSNVDLSKIGTFKLIEKIGSQLAAIEEVEEWGRRFDGIVIVKVVSCEKHPNADKLSVCKIDDAKTVKGIKRDEKGLIQVVCGAPNVAAGMFAVWIPPKVIVPSTLSKEPFALEAREIRGEMSNGMLASSSELGISEDHSGIVELDSAKLAKDTKPGTSLAEALWMKDDLIIDLENKMFTHRPDLFGILGLARELAGIQGLSFKSPDWYLQEPKFSGASDLPLEVKVKNANLIPRFMAVAIKDVKIGPSPLHIQAGLARVGIRPINNVVDITNYVMHVTGQPMHAYDYDKVKARSSGTPMLIARKAKENEKLKLLNGKTLEFKAPAIMIATDHEAVGVGGVMGGADTEVDESSTNIILEAANFDMYSIRRTAMKYGLFTDAVTRFNKGQSPLQNDRVMAYAMKNVCEAAGGTQASDVKDVYKSLQKPGAVQVNAEFINDRLGLSLTHKKIAQLLENVEFKVMHFAKGRLGVAPPFWRTDIEIPEDIVEEVGRLYGYDHLPVELPMRHIKPTPRNELLDFKSQIRATLARAGANEVLTYSFVHGDLLEKVGQDKEAAYKLSNAISPDLQYYRLSTIPSLLDKVHPNIKAGYGEFAIFELGKGHNKAQFDEKDKSLPKEFEMLAFVYAASDKRLVDVDGAPFYQARQYLDYLTHELGINLEYSVIEKEEAYQAAKPYDYSRSASIWDGDTGMPLGMMGEFNSSVIRNLKLPKFTAGFEIGVEQLMAAAKKRHYHVISRFPKVQQDITLKVASNLPFKDLDKEMAKATFDAIDVKKNSVDRQLMSIYQKGKSHKHVTYRFSVVSYERTLTDKEVNNLLEELAAHLQTKFGAERI